MACRTKKTSSGFTATSSHCPLSPYVTQLRRAGQPNLHTDGTCVMYMHGAAGNDVALPPLNYPVPLHEVLSARVNCLPPSSVDPAFEFGGQVERRRRNNGGSLCYGEGVPRSRGLGVNFLPAKGFKRGPPHCLERTFSYRYCRLKPSSSGVLQKK